MAITMISVFIFVAVVGRVLLQYRLTGEHGIRFTTSTSTNTSIVSSLLIVISFIGVIGISLMSAVTGVNLPVQFGPYGNILGVLFCLGGIMLTNIAQIQMGKEWRIGVNEHEKTMLVTKGLYSVVRNPIYTGVMLFGLGLMVLLPHFTMIFFALLGYLAIELQVRKVEEPYLKKVHGRSFANYMKKAGRYIPKWK
jgi:protein-S-isoprenylcysteine O-methyltransferase Ste14